MALIILWRLCVAGASSAGCICWWLAFEVDRRGDVITKRDGTIKEQAETIRQGQNNSNALEGRGQRRDAADAADGAIEREIDNAKDGKDCARSATIGAVLGGLSNRAEEKPADNPR